MAKRRTIQEREDEIKQRVKDAESTLSQYKARLHQLSMQRQTAERKLARRERDRRLFQIGGLAVLAGIDGLDIDALLGAFMSVAKKSHDETTLMKWTMAGSLLHARQAAANAKSKAAQGLCAAAVSHPWGGFDPTLK
ncbi:hypothetical protein MASR1M60_07660 [Rhodocyclaceae bacterium]